MTDDRYQLLRLLEAILFASTEPMSEDQLASRMPEGADINGLLQELKDQYANRGVHLLAFDDRWAFRTAPDLAPKFHIEKEVVRKMSRAAIETLAIIAYHQPATRAEIEEIRGVAVSAGTLDMLPQTEEQSSEAEAAEEAADDAYESEVLRRIEAEDEGAEPDEDSDDLSDPAKPKAAAQSA